MGGYAWSPAEDALLRRHGGKRGGIPTLAARMTNRTRSAIRSRLGVLGVIYKRLWTPAEDVFLRREWGELALSTLAKRLRRSQMAVYNRAIRLGLPRGVPQGALSLRAAARRYGYAVTQIKEIVVAGGFRIRAVPHWRTDPRHQNLYVWSDDVAAAVARWESCEVVQHAARVRGVCGDTLRAKLRAAGVPSPPRGKRWRVPSEVIDRVLGIERTTRRAA